MDRPARRKFAPARLAWAVLLAGAVGVFDLIGDAGWGAVATDADASAGPSVTVATFNVGLARNHPGALAAALAQPGDPQASAVAALIQRVAPDILLLNELDDDPEGSALSRFQANYLARAQTAAAGPVTYPFVWRAPVNTGLASGLDLDGDGITGSLQADGRLSDPDDAYGYGRFPGQYGMALLSRFPIDRDAVRTFRLFRWQSMPGHLIPAEAYDAAARARLRLSSKSHWDVPVRLGAASLHVLAAHPTPPVFDDPVIDRNGRRNHDEIRFWADYIQGGAAAAYLVDDAGRRGGLPSGARFVILGDYNADPLDGDSRTGAMRQLTEHPLVAPAPVPASAGGPAAAARQGGENRRQRGDPAFDTADFYDFGRGAPGNLRVDYVLPGRAGLRATDARVFWPAPGQAGFELVGPGRPVVSSDHRLVAVTLVVVPLPEK